jgi:hypothetical protein
MGMNAPAVVYHNNTDLIARIARMAFEVEAAERREQAAKADRLRKTAAYHEAMAELCARTTAYCTDAQVRVHRSRAGHAELAQTARAELAQLEGRVV